PAATPWSFVCRPPPPPAAKLSAAAGSVDSTDQPPVRFGSANFRVPARLPGRLLKQHAAAPIPAPHSAAPAEIAIRAKHLSTIAIASPPALRCVRPCGQNRALVPSVHRGGRAPARLC